jgi:hypothetical protein
MPKMLSTSKTNKEHKFFERFLDNNLDDLYNYLSILYSEIESGKVYSLDTFFDGNSFVELDRKSLHPADSISSKTYSNYNIFKFEHQAIRNLGKEIKSMVIEACDYYGIDFDEQNYYLHGWFNLYKNPISKNFVETNKDNLGWHEHSGSGMPYFHGYYSVYAEPSTTYYRVFEDDVEISNKNNRAILSETGHPHAMGEWDLIKPRITIAYDVIPTPKESNDLFRRQNERAAFPLF